MPDSRDEGPSRREIERQINDLRRDRARIEDNVRRMEANKDRIFADRETAKRSWGEAQAGEKEEPGSDKKKQRKGSQSGSEQGSDGEAEKKEKKEEKKEEADGDEKEDGEKKEEKEGEEKKEVEKKDERPKATDKRSRNLFGKMLGHLHQAKSRLTKEKSTKAAELKKEAEERLEQKLNMSSINIKEFRKDQFEKTLKEEGEKLVEIAKSIEEKEKKILQMRLEGHYGMMMNFIRTKAEPTIFYIPNKHTKETDKALEETRSAIKHKIASLKVQFQPTPEEAAEAAARAAASAAAMEAAISGKKGSDDEKKSDDEKDEKKSVKGDSDSS